MTIKSFPTYLKRGAVIYLLLIPASVKAHSDVNQNDADNRAKALQTAETSSDSLTILLDVYNLSDKPNKLKVRNQIIDLARHSNNNEVLTDVVNELATTSVDTKELAHLMEISQKISEKGAYKTAETLLQMEQAKTQAIETPENQRDELILQYAKASMDLGLDPYEEITNLYRALAFLGTSSQGPMYLEYITRLGDLVKKLPEKDFAIRNLYLTTAAVFYTRKRDYKNAIDSDRALVAQLDAMAKHETKGGRDVSDLEFFKYISYRRMLRNFMGLTPEEIEEIYTKCRQLAETNEKVAEEFGTRGLSKTYYYIGTGKFGEALPYIKKALSTPDLSKFQRMELMGLLAWAYRETGNTKEELEALREYTVMAGEDNKERREATYREIELRKNVNELMTKEYLETEKVHEENKRMRKTSLTLLYAFGLILILMARAYFKLRQKVKVLESGNKKLRTNIEQIFDNGAPSGTMSLGKGHNRLKG